MYVELELPFKDFGFLFCLEFNIKEILTFISPFSVKGHGCKSAVDFCTALSDVKCAKTSME
jgi:hypothetical protein